jgi:CRP/FNR family transcriptional regulator, anaerobic regulatory protein
MVERAECSGVPAARTLRDFFGQSAACGLLGDVGCRGPRCLAHSVPDNRPRLVPQNMPLLLKGDTARDISGIVLRGLLRRVRLRSDGHRSLLGLAFPGDLVIGSSDWATGELLEAVTEVEICAFEVDALRQMMSEDDCIQRYVMRRITDQHARQLDMIWQRGALNSRERIIAVLVAVARRLPLEACPEGGCILSLPLPRRDWADLANTSVESISRTLGQLADKGLVRTLAPGRYWLRNLGLLAFLAGLGPPPASRSQRAAGAVDCGDTISIA